MKGDCNQCCHVTNFEDQLTRGRCAEEAAADARRPFIVAQDQHEHAKSLFDTRLTDLAGVAAQEAAHISASWPPQPFPAELVTARKAAEAATEFAARSVEVTKSNADAALLPAQKATAEVAKIAAETDGYVRDVMIELADKAVSDLTAALDLAAKHEATARGIAVALAAKKWFREAEPISTALHRLPEFVAADQRGRFRIAD